MQANITRLKRSDMVDSSAVLVVLITIILPPIGMDYTVVTDQMGLQK